MLCYFDLKRHIQIATDVLSYVISGVLSQMISDHSSSGYMTHKYPNSFELIREIG